MLSLECTRLLVQQLLRTYSNHRLLGICPPDALEFKGRGPGFGLSSSVHPALATSRRPSTCLSNAQPYSTQREPLLTIRASTLRSMLLSPRAMPIPSLYSARIPRTATGRSVFSFPGRQKLPSPYVPPQLKAPPSLRRKLPMPSNCAPKDSSKPLGLRTSLLRPPRAATRFKAVLTPAIHSKSSTPMLFPLCSASSICTSWARAAITTLTKNSAPT